MAFKVNDYLKNVRKSGLYLVKDLTKDYLPGSDKIVASIGQTLGSVRKTSQGSYVKSVSNIIKNSSYFNTVHKGILQSFDAIKSGNIYMDDAARLDAQMQASGMGLNFDLDDMGSSDFEVSDDEKAAFEAMADGKREESFKERVSKMNNMRASGVTEGDKVVARSTIESAQAASLATIETMRTIHADNRAFMAKFGGEVTNGITAMHGAIMSIAEFNNSVQKQFVELSTDYYKENNAILSEMVGILKTDREDRIKAMADDSESKVSSSQNYVDHISKGNYGSAGRDMGSRFMRAMDNTYLDGMWGLMGGFLPMLLGQIFADPIGGAIKWGSKAFINKKFKLGSLDGGLDLNQAFASVLSGAATKLSKSESELLKNFAYEMTIKTSEMKATPELGVNMKQLGWNSLAQESLVTVIPTYLRKILAAVSNEEEIVYNYNTGKMRTRDEIASDYASSAPNLSAEVRGLTGKMLDFDKKQKESYFQDMNPTAIHNVVSDILEEFVDKGKDVRDIIATSFEEIKNMVPTLTSEHGWTKENHAALRMLLREMDSDSSTSEGFDILNRDVGRFQSKVIAHWNKLLKGSKLSGASSLFDRSSIVDPTASSVKMASLIARLSDPNMPMEEKMKIQRAMGRGLLDDNGNVIIGAKQSRAEDRISLDRIYNDITSPRIKGSDMDSWKYANGNNATIDPKDAEYIAKALDQETLTSAFVERILPIVKMLKNTKIGDSDEFKQLISTNLYDKEKIIETKGEWTKMYSKEVYKMLRNLPEIKKHFGEFKDEELEGDSDKVDENGKKKSNLEVHMESILAHFGVESPAEAAARVKKLQADHDNIAAERKEAFSKIDSDGSLSNEEKTQKKLELTKGKFSDLISNSSLGKFVKEKIDSAMAWKDKNMPNAGRYALAATGGIMGVGILGKLLGSVAGLGSATASFGITSPLFLTSLGLAAGIWAGKKSLEGDLFGSFTDIQKDNFMKRTLPSVLGGAGIFAVMNRLGSTLLPFGGVLAPIIAATTGIGFSVMAHEGDFFRNMFGNLPKDGSGKIDWKPMMKNGMWGILGAGMGAAGLKLAGGLPMFGNIISGITNSMGLLSPIAMATTAAGLGLLANSKSASKLFFGEENKDKNFHNLMKDWLFGNTAENKKGLFTKHIDRFVGWAKAGKKSIIEYIGEHIASPIRAAMDPAKDLFKNAIFGMKESFNKMTVAMKDDFGNVVTMPFAKMIETRIVEPFTKFLDKTTSWAAGFLGKLISAPIKLFSNIITKSRDRIAERNGGIMPYMRGKINEFGSGEPTGHGYANSNLSWTDRTFGTDGYGAGAGSIDKDSKEASRHRQQDGSFYFSQKNRKWADKKFKDGSTLGEQGCGVAAAAMALSIIHDRMVSPDMLMPVAHNYKSSNGGINPNFFVKAAEGYSLHADVYRRRDVSITDIEKLVRAGNVVVACILKESETSGVMYKHYIVIHGVSGGRWNILDPEDRNAKVIEPMQVMGYLDTVAIIYKDGAQQFKKRNITRMNAQLQERDGTELDDRMGKGLFGKIARTTAALFKSPFGALGIPLQMLGIRNPITLLTGGKTSDLVDSQNAALNQSIDAQSEKLKDDVENKKGVKPKQLGIGLEAKQGQLTIAKAILDMKSIMHKDDMRIIHSLDKINRELAYSLNGVSYNLEYIKRLLASNLEDLPDSDKPDTSLLRNKKFKAAKGTVKNFVDRYVMGPLSSIKIFLSDIHTGVSMYVTDAIAGTKKLFSKAMEVFNPLIKGGKWLLGLPFKFLGMINDLGKVFTSGMMKIGSSVLDIATVTISQSIKFMLDVFSGGVKGVFGSIKTMFDKGIDMFMNLGGSLEGLISGIGTGIGNLFKGLMSGLGGIIGGTFRGIGGGIAAVGSIFKGTFSFVDWFKQMNNEVQKVHVIGGTLDKVTTVNAVSSVAAVDMSHYLEVTNKLRTTNEPGAKDATVATKAGEAKEVNKRQDTAGPEQVKQTEALTKIAESVTKDGKTVTAAKNQSKNGLSIGDNVSNWIQSFLPLVIPGIVGATVSFMTLKNVKNILTGDENIIDNNVMREGDADSMKKTLVRHGTMFGVRHGIGAISNLGKGIYNFGTGLFSGAKATGKGATKLWQWSLNKTVDASADMVKETVANPSKSRKLIEKIGGALVNFVVKIFTNEKIIGLIGADRCAKILSKVGTFGDDFIRVALKSTKGKIKSGMLRSLAILPVIDAFLSIWSFFQGYNNASDFLDVHEEDCTTGMRVVAGLSEAIITGIGSKMPGLSFILGMLPPSWYMTSLYKLVVTEEHEDELDIKQTKFKEDIEKAEAEALAKGEKFSYREYRNKEKAKLKQDKINNTTRVADNVTVPDYAKNRTEAAKPNTAKPANTYNPMNNLYNRYGNGDFISQKSGKYADIDLSLNGEGATFAKAGCGPSTLAMAMSDLGINPNIPSLAEAAIGYRQDESKGVSMKYLHDGLNGIGANNSAVHYNNVSDIMGNLAQGGKSILLSKTNSGSPHYVYAKGLDANGNVILADPLSNGIKSVSPNSSTMRNAKAGIDIGGFGDGVKETKAPKDNSFLASMSNMTTGVTNLASQLIHGLSGGTLSLDYVRERLSSIFNGTDITAGASERAEGVDEATIEKYKENLGKHGLKFTTTGGLIDRATKWVTHHEGFNGKAYQDNGKGISIGHGIFLRKNDGTWAHPSSVTREQAEHWIKNGITKEESSRVIRDHLIHLDKLLTNGTPWYKKLSNERKIAMLDMAYNLGPYGLMNKAGEGANWPKLTGLLDRGEFSEVHNEILGTQYHKDVKGRAMNVITMLQKNAAGPFDGLLKSLGNSVRGQVNQFAKTTINKGTRWLANGVTNAMNVPTRYVNKQINKGVVNSMKASEGLFGKIANWGGRQAGKLYNWMGGKTGVNNNTGNPFLEMINEMLGGFFPGFNRGQANYSNKDYYQGFWGTRPNYSTGGNYLGNILTSSRPNQQANNMGYWNGLFGNGGFGPFDGILKSLGNSVRGQINQFAKTSINKGTRWLANGVTNAMNVPTRYINKQINKGISNSMKSSEGLFGKIANWGGQQAGKLYNWFGGKVGANNNTGNPLLDILNEMLGGFFPNFNKGQANYGDKNYYQGFWGTRPNYSTGGNYTGKILSSNKPNYQANNNKYWNGLFGNGGFGVLDSDKKISEMNKALSEARNIKDIRDMRVQLKEGIELKEAIKEMRNDSSVTTTNTNLDSDLSRRTSDSKFSGDKAIDNRAVIDAINEQTKTIAALLSTLIANGLNPIVVPTGGNNNNVNIGGAHSSGGNFLEEITRISRGWA